MMFQEAQQVLAQFLAPLSVNEFLDRGLTGGFRKLDHDGASSRSELLGADPEATLAGAFHLAPELTYHSANATGAAPSLKDVTGAEDFRGRIRAFHDRNYSVRFPDLRPLSPELDRVARALEAVLQQPVSASAFWSRTGMRAPVHYDDHDLIVVQLRGTKRWYVSSEPSQLFNTWKGISGNPPDLGAHHVVDVKPGDLMYLPRGTFHTVDSDSESIHLAIGFTPLTLRELMIAALDHLSDLDPGLRETAGGRVAYQLRDGRVDMLAPATGAAAARLLEAVRAPGFLNAALQRRASRAIGSLAALPRPTAVPAIGLDTVLAHADRAVSHLTANAETIDFSFPGGHLYIHRGAQDAVVFITDTPRFRVRDIPGDVADDVRIALATRFFEVGFLTVA